MAAKTRRKTRRRNAFLEAAGSVPPLDPPLMDSQQTEIAAEEAAQEAVGRTRKLETPQEFYKRVTRVPGIRELLSRLAKK